MSEQKDDTPLRDAEIDLNIDRALFPEIFGNMSEEVRERIMQHREQFPNDLKHRNQHRLNRANRYLGERDVLGEAEAYHRYINEPLQPPKKQKNIGVKSMPDTPQKQQQQGPEPYSAQVLREFFKAHNDCLQWGHQLLGPMECPKGRKIVEKALQNTVSLLDTISNHFNNHELYQGLAPLEDDVEEDELHPEGSENPVGPGETDSIELSPEEQMTEEAASPADPAEVGETMQTKKLLKKLKALTKDFTEKEADEVEEKVEEEAKDTEDDPGEDDDTDGEDDDDEPSDEDDEDDGENGKGEEDDDEELSEAEKEDVMASLDFLKAIPVAAAWDDETRFKAYHLHKQMDRIGAKAAPLPKPPTIYGVLPPDPSVPGHELSQPDQPSDSRHGDTHVMGVLPPEGNDTGDQLSKLLKDLGGIKPPPAEDKFHKGMPADLETFATKRARCKGLAGFLKELSGTKWLQHDHRQKALVWQKDLEGMLCCDLPTSKDGEEELPAGTELPIQEEVSPGDLDPEASGQMGEKKLGVKHLTKVLEERSKAINELMGKLGVITQSLNVH